MTEILGPGFKVCSYFAFLFKIQDPEINYICCKELMESSIPGNSKAIERILILPCHFWEFQIIPECLGNWAI
jgi:hypothetical protein